MANTVENAVRSGKQTARNMEEKATRKAREAKGYIDDKLNDNSLEGYAESAGRHLRQWQSEAEEKFSQGKDYAETTVKKNPLMAVGAAFLAGAVLTSLFRR